MSGYLASNKKKITPAQVQDMKARGEKIVMVTAYDYTMASIINATEVDMILVGDSASNVILGNDTTLPITLAQMALMARSVVRGAAQTYVVCDMPFGTYGVTPEEGVRHAIQLVQQSGCDALKLEGGAHIASTIRAIVALGIPVVAHLGLTPQHIHAFGNYAVRAREAAEAAQLLADAQAVVQAGAMAVVLEKIPAAIASQVTAQISVPTIGIGAGAQVDGQVLVGQDLLGMNVGFAPKFLRRYADLHTTITQAMNAYAADVKSGSFPSTTEQY